jgi:hypothetical protein
VSFQIYVFFSHLSSLVPTNWHFCGFIFINVFQHFSRGQVSVIEKAKNL